MNFKKHALTAIFAFSLATLSTSHALAAYATSIVDSSPLANGSSTGVIGMPDSVVAAYDQASASIPGFVTVSFDEPFGDVAGFDLFVHVIEWPLSENEVFEVFASLDGTPGSFFSLGPSGPPSGGNVIVGFDLGAAGMTAARYVRVQNSRLELGVSSEGPEIDAIQSVQPLQGIPEPGSLALLAFGLGLVGLTGRRARGLRQPVSSAM